MRLSRATLLVLLAGLACAAGAAQPPDAPAVPAPEGTGTEVAEPDLAEQQLSQAARNRLDRARGSIVQIRGFLSNSASSAFHGSGFAITSILAIFFGNQFVDRRFSAERFMAVSHLIGGLAMLGLYFTRDFPTFFALMLVHSICYVPTISVANSMPGLTKPSFAMASREKPRRPQ